MRSPLVPANLSIASGFMLKEPLNVLFDVIIERNADMKLKQLTGIGIALLVGGAGAWAEPIVLSSPDNSLAVSIETGGPYPLFRGAAGSDSA